VSKLQSDGVQRYLEAVIRPEVRAIKAYHVPSAAGFIKLDAMENPFGLPAEMARQLADRLAAVALNRYPPADPQAFKTKLAQAVGLPQIQTPLALMLGNGSDELIHLVIQACARPGATIMSPWPSFVMYDMSATFDGCRFVGVPLTEDFALDRDVLLAAMAEHRPAVIFIAWPNNPTGNLFDRATVNAVLDTAPGLVVLDEAYLPFAQDTWLPQLAERPNLLVLRTLSKLGLAGIRLGYLCGDAAWIAEFDKLRPQYNVNVLTLAAAEFMLEQLPLLDAQAATLREERSRLMQALRALPGVTAFDSAANFILLRVAAPDAVFAGLKERGILIKNVSRMHPRLAGCLRTTVGTRQENDAFLHALQSCLAS
jgi:histidinol-phosphate aminotransferase